MVCGGAPESFSSFPNQENLCLSSVVSAGNQSDEVIDFLLDPPLEGGPPLGRGPPLAWGPLYPLAGLTAAAAGGALLGALREKRPQHVAKVRLRCCSLGAPKRSDDRGPPYNLLFGGPSLFAVKRNLRLMCLMGLRLDYACMQALAVAGFLLPAAASILLLSTSPLPGGPPSLSLQEPAEVGAPPPSLISLLGEYLLGALQDWQHSLSFAAACMLLLRGARGFLLLTKAPSSNEGAPLLNSMGAPLSHLSLARTTAASKSEGAPRLLSLLQAEALPTWRGPQGRRAWGLSIALQMCLLVFLPWLGAALWLLRPAAAAAAVWVSGPCLPSGSAAAAAAAAATAATEGSRLESLLLGAAQAAKALNPSVLLSLSLLLSLPLKLIPSFAAADAALAACCRWGAASRFLALISSSSSSNSSGSRSSKGAPYAARLIAAAAAAAAAAALSIAQPCWCCLPIVVCSSSSSSSSSVVRRLIGDRTAKGSLLPQGRLESKDATVVAEVSKGEVQVHNKTAAAAAAAAADGGTTGLLFRDKDGDEAYEFFHVDACGLGKRVRAATACVLWGAAAFEVIGALNQSPPYVAAKGGPPAATEAALS
ncbi:hypothetical protein Emag_003605 [Eimeria magna]